MTEPIVLTPARCEDCNKVYRVANPDKTYPCKACGGTVRASGEPEHLSNAITCSGCHAINAGGAHFCAECGAVLTSTAPEESQDEAVSLRLEASNALRRAYKPITAVTWLYRLGALAYALATLFAVLALARTDVPAGPGVLVVVLMTLLTVLMLMGAIHILFQPVVWTLAIASLATVVSVVHAVGPNPFGVAAIGSALWAAVAWAALAPTMRFRRLMDEHRDLYILHHSSRQTQRSVKGQFAKERHGRLMAAMERAARRAWKVSALAAGSVCVLSVAGTFWFLSLRPQELSPIVASFGVAWNDSDLAAVGSFFDPELREQESARLAGLTAGHGWADELPFLDEGRMQPDDGTIKVVYEVDGRVMSARWALVEKQWSLIRVELPVPPLEPALERLLQAWGNSDPKAVAAFFSAENQDRMVESIEAAAERRDWRSFPDVLFTEVSDYEEGKADVVLVLNDGKRVMTKWYLRGDGTWGVQGLKFPSS